MVQNFNWTRYLLKYEAFQERVGLLFATDVSLTQFFLYKGTLAEWLSRLEQPTTELTMQQILQM